MPDKSRPKNCKNTPKTAAPATARTRKTANVPTFLRRCPRHVHHLPGAEFLQNKRGGAMPAASEILFLLCFSVFFVFVLLRFLLLCVLLCVVAPQGLQAVLTWLLPLDGRIPAKLFGQTPGNSRSCLRIVRCNAVKFSCNALPCAPLKQRQRNVRLHNWHNHSCLNCSSKILPL